MGGGGINSTPTGTIDFNQPEGEQPQQEMNMFLPTLRVAEPPVKASCVDQAEEAVETRSEESQEAEQVEQAEQVEEPEQTAQPAQALSLFLPDVAVGE